MATLFLLHCSHTSLIQSQDFLTDNSMAASIGVILFLFWSFVQLAVWASSDDHLPTAPIVKEEDNEEEKEDETKKDK